MHMCSLLLRGVQQVENVKVMETARAEGAAACM